MSEYTTNTLTHIVALSEAEQLLLNKTEWSAADKKQCAEIQSALAKLWPIRRAELVFERAGPPRLLGGGTDRDQQRAIAHGIQPLPHAGGD